MRFGAWHEACDVPATMTTARCRPLAVLAPWIAAAAFATPAAAQDQPYSPQDPSERKPPEPEAPKRKPPERKPPEREAPDREAPEGGAERDTPPKKAEDEPNGAPEGEADRPPEGPEARDAEDPASADEAAAPEPSAETGSDAPSEASTSAEGSPEERAEQRAPNEVEGETEAADPAEPCPARCTDEREPGPPSVVPDGVADRQPAVSVGFGPPHGQPWHEGDDIPPGYEVDRRVNTGLVVAGSVTFGTAWLVSAGAASHLINEREDSFFDRVDDGVDEGDDVVTGEAALYVPLAGPWIALGTMQHEGAGTMLLVADGLVQAGGLAMLVAGVSTGDAVLVRDEDSGAQVSFAPAPTGGALVGRF